MSQPGYNKYYDGANGHFLDTEGRTWEVYKISRNGENLYLRWDIDGEDPGASFVDADGVYTPFTEAVRLQRRVQERKEIEKNASLWKQILGIKD